jgi:hypothetical protein
MVRIRAWQQEKSPNLKFQSGGPNFWGELDPFERGNFGSEPVS